MRKGVRSYNNVKSVHDRVSYNNVCVLMTSVSVCLAAFSGDRLSCGAARMPSELASAELGKSPESYEQSEQ